MCTVRLLPRKDGYLLGMNRDEKIARGTGSPPEFTVYAKREPNARISRGSTRSGHRAGICGRGCIRDFLLSAIRLR